MRAQYHIEERVRLADKALEVYDDQDLNAKLTDLLADLMHWRLLWASTLMMPFAWQPNISTTRQDASHATRKRSSQLSKGSSTPSENPLPAPAGGGLPKRSRPV